LRPAEPGQPAAPGGGPSAGPLLDLVRLQVDLGPRCPGCEAQRRLLGELSRRLAEHGAEVHRQDFPVRLPGGTAECANLTGVFRPARKRPPALGREGLPPLLLGTHFDTRLIADREPDPAPRARPIPGANDGGSGTAVLLSLLPELSRLAAAGELDREVRVVFFDAEDVGGIAGQPFALGAWHYARRPALPPPGEVLVLDMVGGSSLELDVDDQALEHRPSLELTRRVFAAGWQVDGAVFRAAKWKRIISDHYPFLRAGIASCLLIDLDYPEWHTQSDLPAAMSERSLATIAAAVLRFLQGPPR
jgi:glutaminyl-peptide cyclotransferase